MVSFDSGITIADNPLRVEMDIAMNTDVITKETGEEVMKRESATEYSLVSDTLLDKFIRVTYRVAYLGHLAVNFFIRPKTRGAYVALWLDGRMLLIRNSYKSVHTLPCGGIDRGETPVEAAHRELLEEVGLDVPIEQFRQVWQQVNHTEFKQDHIFLFEVHLQTPPRLKPDGREVVWVGFRDRRDALAMPVFPPVRDYLLQQQQIYGEN